MKIYRYTFNPSKCHEFTIKDNRGNLYYPSELDGKEYFSAKDDENVVLDISLTLYVGCKNEWFNIEELEVHGSDEAIEEENEVDGFQVFADSLRGQSFADSRIYSEAISGLGSLTFCPSEFGLEDVSNCDGISCSVCWHKAFTRKALIIKE